MAKNKYNPNHYHVYVIELKKEVLEDKKFLKANPGYDQESGKPPLYVGMTGLTPRVRFEKHKAGHKGNKYVYRWSVGLRRDFCAHLKPMPYEKAMAMEVSTADRLRQEGYAVWQH